MENRKKIIAIGVAVLMLLITSVGLSFAYFTASLSGGETGETITVSGGTLSIVYNDNNPNIYVSEIIPQAEPVAVKTFTVTGNNTTELPMAYYLSLVVEANGFSSNALTYKLSSTNTGSSGTPAPGISSHQGIANGSKTYSLGEGSFAQGTGKVHTYELDIYFLDTGENQNINQGKTFKARVGISGEAYETFACNLEIPPLEPVQMGDNAYLRIEETGDMTIYGTGSTWKDHSAAIEDRINAHYMGGEFYVQIYEVIKEGIMSKEEMLSMSREEAESQFPEGVTYEQVVDFLNNIECYIDIVPELSGHVIIEEGITRLESNNLWPMDSIEFPESLEEIGSYAFYGNYFETLTIPNNVRIIEDHAFAQSTGGAEPGRPYIKTLVLGNSVQIIGDFAFGYTGLTSLVVPASVEEIGTAAFANYTWVTQLTNVSILGADPQRFNGIWDNIGFYDAPKPS